MDHSTVSERLGYLINYLGYNTNSFSVNIGLTSNNVIGRIINDKERAPSYLVLNKIAETFPEVNLRWLITGDGDILHSKRSPWDEPGTIKYYKTSSFKDFHNAINKISNPISVIKISGMEGCDYAFDIIGASMTPTFSPGDIVLCCETDEEPVVFGEPYLIIGKNFAVIRIIKRLDEQNNLVARIESDTESENIIKMHEIDKILSVKGIIKRLRF